MSKKRTLALTMVLAMGASTLLGGCVDPETLNQFMEETEETVDFSNIRPQDDFYGYVNAETLINTPVDPEYGTAGSFLDVALQERAQMKEALSAVVHSDEDFEPGSSEQILREAYRQYVDYLNDEEQQKAAAKEVEADLDRILQAKDYHELLKVSVDLEIKYQAQGFFLVSADQDQTNCSENAIYFPQIMAWANADLSEVKKSQNAARISETMTIAYLAAMGYSTEEAQEYGKALAIMGIKIAEKSDFSIADSQNFADSLYFCTTDELNEILTVLTPKEIEEVYGIDENPYGGWMVQDLEQMKAFNNLLTEENFEAVKMMCYSNTIQSCGSFLRIDYPKLETYFPKETEITDEKILEVISSTFDDQACDVYVDAVYTEEMDEALNKMCEGILDGYRGLIAGADWLSEEGRECLRRKLDGIIFLTGAEPRGEITEADKQLIGENLFESLVNVNKRSYEEIIAKVGSKNDRNRPKMSMNTANACYMNDNTVTITIAIMGQPFFDVNADYYANLGGLGMVVAHEVGHAFDSNCIKYDENGVYNPGWLPEEDVKILEERNQCAIKYFEEYFTVFDVYHVDGERTLGENYADLGALECITSCCKTDEELETLLRQFAIIWASLEEDDGVINTLEFDVHSPAIIRVNAMLASNENFIELYDVKEGDGLYVAPENRISRWY